jgi:Subtilase family
VPLRVTRLAKAAAVAGLAAAPVIAIGLPAHASFAPTAEYWLRTSHIAQAWRTDQGAGVIVAVLADGVAAGQSDISGSVIVGPAFTGSGRRPGGRYFGVLGTGLASLIVGHGHAKHQGVFGVAAAAKVLSVRVTLSPGDPLWARSRITSRLPAAIGAGIRYAVKHGASVIEHRQPYVALTAAGRQVIAASRTGYQTMNSTWAASAIAAGVAALVRSEFPTLTAAQIRNAMIDGAAPGRPGGSSAGAAHRTVDAEGAIAKAMRMSPPDANLAMKGALPRISPATPPEPSLGSSIQADLIRDGIISLAALVAMLVPITWYGSVARRRDRLVLAAELERRERARPEQGPMPADPLLEYFAPQHIRPADRPPQPRSAPSPRFQPTSTLTGRPALAQTSRAVRLGLPSSPALPPSPSSPALPPSPSSPALPPSPSSPALPPSPSSPALPPSASLPPPPSGVWGTQANTGQANTGRATMGSAFSPARESAGRPGHGDARNGSEPTVRQASVTGSPPWEPAPEPTTALPWGPQPSVAHPPVPPAAAPSAAAPSAAAPSGTTRGDRPAQLSMPPRSLFDPSPVLHLSAPTMGPRDTSESGSHGTTERGASSQDSGSRPIYVWDPSSTGALGEGRDDKSGWLPIGHDPDLPAGRGVTVPSRRVSWWRAVPCAPRRTSGHTLARIAP